MTATVSAKTASKIKKPYYPTRDGEPMAEFDLHWDVTAYCCNALRSRYASQPNVYVASDNFLYYERGQPKSVVSPDCYVIFGAGMRMRELVQGMGKRRTSAGCGYRNHFQKNPKRRHRE